MILAVNRAVRAPALLAAALAGLLLLGVVVAGCGRPPSGRSGPSDPIVVRVGTGADPGDRLLAEIYATGLQIRGVSVERRFDLDPGQAPVSPVRDGTVDLVPARTGRLLRSLDPTATATAPDEVYREARAALPPPLTLLDKARAETKDVVVVPRRLAVATAVRSLADLGPRCATTAAGGSPAFTPAGLAGLHGAYGCSFRSFRPLDPATTAAALRDGELEVGVLPSTDAAIAADNLVALDDPLSALTAQNVVPLTTSATTADPRVTEVLDKISSQLDTVVLADLERRTTGPDALTTAQVARDWLASAGVG